MADSTLRLGDKGPEVAIAQDLLNRQGALLITDGDFGYATSLAVYEFRAANDVDGPFNEIEATTWKALRDLPEPSPDMPTEAVTFIAREEVGSRAQYDAQSTHPSWPGGDSGVTIGVGYDLGYQTRLVQDWQDLLTKEDLLALMPALGCIRQTAEAMAGRVQHITIPWHAAWNGYVRRTLPEQVALTRATFKSDKPLPPFCFGALVSLVYNRGPSTIDSSGSDRRREMREMRAAVSNGEFDKVPDLLLSMRRLWPQGSGLIGRREREAAMFAEGLKG